VAAAGVVLEAVFGPASFSTVCSIAAGAGVVVGVAAADLAAALAVVVVSADLAEAILAAGEQVVTGNSPEQSETSLTDLSGRLKTAFGERLVSVILYGSAARVDRVDRVSDLNVLCVLDRITTAELAKSEPVFRWWTERGNPPPLLLTAEEVNTSTDCFPMEYHDMREQRRVLYGSDVIESLQVENSAYRAQVEHELRAKQIRLRQKAAESLTQADRLLKLLTQSVSTFCVLGRHALILSGNHPRFKKVEIVAGLESVMGRKLESFRAILAARETGKLAAGQTPMAALEEYLSETDALVRFVDGLGK
jgi:hypothetical protein